MVASVVALMFDMLPRVYLLIELYLYLVVVLFSDVLHVQVLSDVSKAQFFSDAANVQVIFIWSKLFFFSDWGLTQGAAGPSNIVISLNSCSIPEAWVQYSS